MKKMKIERDGNLLRIGNKWNTFLVNLDGDFNTGTHTLEEVDKEKRDKQINLLTNALFTSLDPKLVMRDALKDMTEEELYKLYKYIKKHRDIKPKVKKDCVAMSLGGVDIPIRG